MSLFKQGRYSGYLRPFSYTIDLSIINGLAIFYFFKNLDPLLFFITISIAWILLSLASRFYEVYRFTREVTILSLVFKQLILFALIIFAYSGLFREYQLYPVEIIKYVLLSFFFITVVKFAIYYFLQKYRSEFGGNYRKTVIFGGNKKTIALQRFFNENPEYGYVHKKTFNFKENKNLDLQECFDYILEFNIDEIYCSISDLSNFQINETVDFADNNLKILKFLPDNKEIYSKKLKYEYYDYLPILSMRNIPLETPLNTFLKRSFDIVFSSFVIIFILSWLTPIVALMIKLESKGPVFFKQSRNGFNYQEFECYKFRSMLPNQDAH